MASSVPAAVDWLVAQISAAVADRPDKVVVSDGWPVERGNDVIAVGITADEDDSTVAVAYAQLSGLDQEDVTLPSVISVRRSGRGAASAARAAAVQLLDTVRGVVAADRRLGGAVVTGLPARVAAWSMRPTSSAKPAGEGRTCMIQLLITWQHRG